MWERITLLTYLCVTYFSGTSLGDCPLPPHPAHGRHQPRGSVCVGADRPAACDSTPGAFAPEYWLLAVHCDAGYQQPDPDVFSVCTNGAWSIPNLPSCRLPDLLTHDREPCTVPEPPPHSQYEPLEEECGIDFVLPSSSVPKDCILFLSCLPGYRPRIGSGDMLLRCSNKTWNLAIPRNLCIRDVNTQVTTPNQVTKTLTSPPDKLDSPSFATSPVSSTSCVLPAVSNTSRFCSLAAGCELECDFYNTACLLHSGSRVDRVRVVCAPGHTVQTTDIAVCVSTGWYRSFPRCIKLCRPLASYALFLSCHYGSVNVDCSKSALPNTTVSFHCQPGFSEYPGLKNEGVYKRHITCKSSGEWSGGLPPCRPVCGVSKEAQKFSPTIVDGEEAYVGLFPWHAGLYYREEKDGAIHWKQICGGTLIKERVVLTDIKYPYQYNPNIFSFDIALVFLSEKIKYGEYIMPVCLDYDESTTELLNYKMYVVGWGRTDASVGGPSSEILLYNIISALSEVECKKVLPPYYPAYEKFCALNNSESVTQKGDSGGGLTTVHRDGLHYIVGIVSTKYGRVSLFTNIKWKVHAQWISDEIIGFEKIYAS